ncbi:uncharacterized protein LOC126750552 isoform X2 [Anthonomus grandis grandis]|uniref:uncharacterized protein LOC126750552 isoform X2 n=1 Tax=Anthonomus grandis grandis TaxID=2921223 RepID=UPI002164F88A|nr:uncharacterized protein LOC126750552 isoform X2 [Anthonomus grandis grandis]
MWYVVAFTKESSVATVPLSWYIEKSSECFWPPSIVKRATLEKLIKDKVLPEEDWKPFKAEILGKYSDYKQAMAKLQKAKSSDKLTTTDDNEDKGKGKRKRKPSHKIHNTSSSDADESSGSVNSLSFPSFSKHLQTNFANYEVYPSRNANKSSRDFNMPKRSRSLSPFKEAITFSPQDSQRRSEREDIYPKRKEDMYKRKSLLQQNLFENGHKQTEITQPAGEKLVQIFELLQKIQADSSEFRVQVLRKLNIINIKINDLETTIENLKNNSNIPENEEMLFEDFINLFPLDMEKLNTLENVLLNQNEMKKLTKYLSRVGGSDVSEIVKRLMYKIFTNELGTLFSWDGAKGKLKFKNLRIATVILDTVRNNPSTKDSTEADVIIHVKKWLVRAKERIHLENKQKRQNRNDMHESEPRSKEPSSS